VSWGGQKLQPTHKSFSRNKWYELIWMKEVGTWGWHFVVVVLRILLSC
jgi:hypothetical protein